MYSQNDEERAILECFGGELCRFLDVGAYDGIHLSNTRALVERGWSGVYVEPSPASVLQLIKNSEPFKDRVQIVQAAVSDHNGISRFYIDAAPDRGWSTTINRDLLESGSVIKPLAQEVFTAVIRMDDLVPMGTFDFVSIDAEWEDLAIVADMIRGNGREILTSARLICIETRNLDERAVMRSWLASAGFSDFHETPENLLMGKPK